MADLDITGGYDPDLDYFLPTLPENPDMRDSASIWFSDSKGRIGLPRFCIEAVASEWDNRGVEANIAFPNGRVLIGAGGYAPSPAKFVDGKAVTANEPGAPDHENGHKVFPSAPERKFIDAAGTFDHVVVFGPIGDLLTVEFADRDIFVLVRQRPFDADTSAFELCDPCIFIRTKVELGKGKSDRPEKLRHYGR